MSGSGSRSFVSWFAALGSGLWAASEFLEQLFLHSVLFCISKAHQTPFERGIAGFHGVFGDFRFDSSLVSACRKGSRNGVSHFAFGSCRVGFPVMWGSLIPTPMHHQTAKLFSIFRACQSLQQTVVSPKLGCLYLSMNPNIL